MNTLFSIGWERFYINEKEKIDGVYTDTWIDMNSKALLELLANGDKIINEKFEEQLPKLNQISHQPPILSINNEERKSILFFNALLIDLILYIKIKRNKSQIIYQILNWIIREIKSLLGKK